MGDYPRWLMGGPDDTAGRSPCLLREVAPGLFVGSALAAEFVEADTLVFQFSTHAVALFGTPVVLPFDDGEAVPPWIIARVVEDARVYRPLRPILMQCYAGLSRSASLAYAVLRMVDGLAHEEALARVAHAVEHHDRTTRWPRPVTLASVVAWCEAATGTLDDGGDRG